MKKSVELTADSTTAQLPCDAHLFLAAVPVQGSGTKPDDSYVHYEQTPGCFVVSRHPGAE